MKHNKDYFLQNVVLERTKFTRKEFIVNFIQNKSVLHVGFVDWPITNVKSNLHLSIASMCRRLDGIDVNINSETEKLFVIPNGTIYKNWNDVQDIYDVIIIPEVIEHVGNLAEFLQLFDRFTSKIIITAPDAFQLKDNFQFTENGYYEHVHPDHNYWFSPFTLKNIINKYMKNKKIQKMYLIHGSVAAVVQ